MPRRWAVPAVCALVMVLVSGCSWFGPEDGEPNPPSATVLPKYYDPARLLYDVDARMRADGGSPLSVSGTLTGATTGPVPVSGDGALHLEGDGRSSARLVLRSGPAGAAPRSIELVRIGDRTWLRPPDAGWVEAGTTPLPSDLIDDGTLAANVSSGLDPLAAVSRYRDAVLVADAADTTVAGTPAVHYTLVVDLVRAIAGERDPARRDALVAQQRAGTTRLSSEIWLDAQRHPLRGRIRQQLPGARALDVVVDYLGWGAPVTIDPPVRG